MKARYFIKKLLAAFRNLLNFKRPSFTQLDFIDLVIDDSPLFLLVWKSTNARLLKIKSIGTYHKADGSIFIQIPPSIDHVTLVLKNTWRSAKINVAILHTRLDQKTASILLNKIKQVKPNGEVIWKTPLSTVTLHSKPLFFHKKMTGTIHTKPVLNKTNINAKIVRPFITKQPLLQFQKFIYSQNTD